MKESNPMLKYGKEIAIIAAAGAALLAAAIGIQKLAEWVSAEYPKNAEESWYGI